MKRLFGNLLGLAVIVAAVSFFAAPAVAFFAIRSAAEANDVQALSRLIDFGAVRQALRPQLAGRPEALEPAPSFLDDPVGAVRRQFENARPTPGPQPDAYLTPAAIAGLMRGEGRYAATRQVQPAPEDVGPAPWPSPVYWGVNRVRMAVADEGGSRTIFTFERTGPFEWRLTHLGLPDGATPVAPNVSTTDAPPTAVPPKAG